MKTFFDWLESNGLSIDEGKAQLAKTYVGKGIEVDGKFAYIETEDGKRIGPLSNIRAINQDDRERPGNRFYAIDVGRGMSGDWVSMDDITAKKVLTTFYSIGKQINSPNDINQNVSPGVASDMFKNLAARQGRIGGSRKPGSAKIIM